MERIGTFGWNPLFLNQSKNRSRSSLLSSSRWLWLGCTSPSRTLHFLSQVHEHGGTYGYSRALERPRTSYETVEPAWAACLRPTWPTEGAPPEGIRGCSADASKPNLLGALFS